MSSSRGREASIAHPECERAPNLALELPEELRSVLAERGCSTSARENEAVGEAVRNLINVAASSNGPSHAVLAACFRWLRNACGVSQVVQHYTPSDDELQALWQKITFLQVGLSPSSDEVHKSALRCGLQFLFNLCNAGDSSVKRLIWSTVSADIRNHLLSSDDKASNYATALLYVCWPEDDILWRSFISPDSPGISADYAGGAAESGEFKADRAPITSPISVSSRFGRTVETELAIAIDVVKIITSGRDSEWGFYLIESLVSQEYFIHSLWPHVELDERQLLIEQCAACLEKGCSRSAPHEIAGLPVWISNTQFICNTFVSAVQDAASRSHRPSGDGICDYNSGVSKVFVSSSSLVRAALEYLCLCSAQQPCPFTKLFDDSKLLLSAIGLLKEVREYNKRREDQQVRDDSLSGAFEASNSERASSDGCDGRGDGGAALSRLSSYLVQLIGNLSFQHRQNQDMVRETGGLQLILDCTCIDADSPFTTQWAIMAIRNLCEGNTENQDFLRSLRLRGLTPQSASLLSKLCPY